MTYVFIAFILATTVFTIKSLKQAESASRRWAEASWKAGYSTAIADIALQHRYDLPSYLQDSLAQLIVNTDRRYEQFNKGERSE